MGVQARRNNPYCHNKTRQLAGRLFMVWQCWRWRLKGPPAM